MSTEVHDEGMEMIRRERHAMTMKHPEPDPELATKADVARLEEKIDFVVSVLRALHPEWVNLTLPQWRPSVGAEGYR